MSYAEPDEIKKWQRTDWNAAAPGWRKWESQFLQNLQPLTDMLAAEAGIKSGYKVLDMATGTGEPALTLAEAVGPKGSIVGVDLSQGMLAVAKERAVARRLENVTFLVNENDDLPALHDNSFDAAVCRLGLMFMPDPVRVLASIRRVLRPHARVAVAVWGPPEKVPFFTTSSKIVAKHFPEMKRVPPGTAGGPFGIPSQEMLSDIFRGAGLAGFSSQWIHVDVIQNISPDEYWQVISEMGIGMVDLLAKSPPEKRKTVKDEVLQALSQMFPGGSVTMGGESLIGSGAKP